MRPDELQCVDQRLRQGGLSVVGAIQQGIMPNDPRLASVRLACRNDVGLESPSFDCTRAALPDERAICKNPELARLDRLVSAGYNYVRAARRAGGKQLGNAVAGRYRRLCGANVDCIREAQVSAIKVYRENGAPVELPTELVQQQSPPIYSVDGFALEATFFRALPITSIRVNQANNFSCLLSASVRRQRQHREGNLPRLTPSFTHKTVGSPM